MAYNCCRDLVVGAITFFLIDKGLVHRKVSAPVLYGLVVVVILSVGLYGNALIFAKLMGYTWLLPALILGILIFSALDGRFWLPAFCKPNQDEVGIKKSILRSFRRKRRLIIIGLLIVLIASAACLWINLVEKK